MTSKMLITSLKITRAIAYSGDGDNAIQCNKLSAIIVAVYLYALHIDPCFLIFIIIKNEQYTGVKVVEMSTF